MSEATKLVNKRDFSSCAYMVDFSIPSHKLLIKYVCVHESNFYSYHSAWIFFLCTCVVLWHNMIIEFSLFTNYVFYYVYFYNGFWIVMWSWMRQEWFNQCNCLVWFQVNIYANIDGEIQPIGNPPLTGDQVRSIC